MTTNPRDPLLAAARLMLVFMMGMMGAISLACLLAVPALFLFAGHFQPEFAEAGLPPEAVWAFAAAGVLLLVCVGLGFFFFRNLYRIVGTVREGDPFIPVNAERLAAMGWIVVAVHVALIPLVAVVHWVAERARDVHTEAHVDPMGILLALILFILARVFREGTRMREELEGTV
jgi:hypothetical protein